jgi:hypothetical protein
MSSPRAGFSAQARYTSLIRTMDLTLATSATMVVERYRAGLSPITRLPSA